MNKERLRAKLRKVSEQLILKATEQLLASDGCHNFTATQLAQIAGVGKGTLYNHMPSEGSWVEAAVASRSRELIELSGSASKSDHWRDRFTSLVVTVVEAAEAPKTDRLGPPCCLACVPCRHSGWAPIETALATFLRKGREAGELSHDCDIDLTAELLKFLVVAGVKGTATSVSKKKHRLGALKRLYLGPVT